MDVVGWYRLLLGLKCGGTSGDVDCFDVDGWSEVKVAEGLCVRSWTVYYRNLLSLDL